MSPFLVLPQDDHRHNVSKESDETEDTDEVELDDHLELGGLDGRAGLVDHWRTIPGDVALPVAQHHYPTLVNHGAID